MDQWHIVYFPSRLGRSQNEDANQSAGVANQANND
jgi:hypothetical protein